ncbi:hypothetical protein RF11_13377 [Thelohanellus kitauei]|uniref:Uncharacterized protein n=1 Tax=Thelohanellus kitauei TaxID=669202 RepID=A0A0C2LZQ4_THEKT|nr:hypothetical protein RF11_13377 [Thelohanellus kitauei]
MLLYQGIYTQIIVALILALALSTSYSDCFCMQTGKDVFIYILKTKSSVDRNDIPRNYSQSDDTILTEAIINYSYRELLDSDVIMACCITEKESPSRGEYLDEDIILNLEDYSECETKVENLTNCMRKDGAAKSDHDSFKIKILSLNTPYNIYLSIVFH